MFCRYAVSGKSIAQETIMTLFEYIQLLHVQFKESCEKFDLGALYRTLTDNGDFLTAPASIKFHLSFRHGLFIHSMHVYHMAKTIASLYAPELSERSVFIVSICHDLCKVGYYGTEVKGQKTVVPGQKAKWRDCLQYTVQDSFPFGHGEKSAHLAATLVSLTPEEALAIRWHLGYMDIGVHTYYPSGAPFKAAFGSSSLVKVLVSADLMAALAEEEKGFKTICAPTIEKIVVNVDDNLQVS
jgi:hypothetical protein